MPSVIPRAVIFDFDGTLADSYDAITASVNFVRAANGLPALPEAEIKKHVGRGLDKLLDDLLPGSDVERNVALYRAHHGFVMRAHTRLMPEAREALTALKRGGRRLAVCSNKNVEFTRALLDSLSVAAFFDVVLGPGDVPRPKPAPDMLLDALRRLGAVPGEALYVGDMDVDVQTARAAGVAVWVVPTGSADRATLEAARPDRILDGLGELARMATDSPRPCTQRRGVGGEG
jgi:phosphoglycolate phosphatase